MKHRYHSRKVRQLDRLIKEMKAAMQNGQPKSLVDRIGKRITRLINELKGILSTRQFIHKLGALAVVFGFATSASAQQFAMPEDNPWGFEPDTLSYAGGLVAADFDDDGDFDLLLGGYYGQFNYYENTGTAAAPVFDTALVNPFALNSAVNVAFLDAADIDDDGDIDLLVGQYYGSIAYYENLGTASSPLFAAPSLSPFGIAHRSELFLPNFVDLDDDGDYDIMAGLADSLVYFENIGDETNPSYGPLQNDPFGAVFGTSLYFGHPTTADLDGDGDFDLLLSSYYGIHTYYQNAGSVSVPQFAGAQQNPFGLNNVADDLALSKLVDIDNDGDYDILAQGTDGNLWFWENTQFNVGLGEIANNVSIGPNPFQNEIQLRTETKLDLIEVYDMTGKMVYSEVSPDGTVSLESLNNGLYMVQVIDANGLISRQKMEKL